MNIPDQLTKSVDLGVYGMDAVLKSAYRFTGRCFIEIKQIHEQTAEVSIRPKQATGNTEALFAEFFNDLIDQRLRTIVATETSATRDLIMAHALSQTDFIRPELESASSIEDPLGITTPDKLRTKV